MDILDIFFWNTKAIALQTGTKLPDTDKHPHGYLDAGELFLVLKDTPNWGLVVDGQFIVVDIDKPEAVPESFLERLPATYRQKTKRGEHYVYRMPPGVDMSLVKNIKLKNGETIFADVKVKGYIVGAGSTVDGHTYTHNNFNVEQAPEWVLKAVRKPASETPTEHGEGRPGIPNGEHDEFLHRLASWLRGQADLSESAIYRVLQKGPLRALQDVDDTRPYEDTDLARIARSAARYAPENGIVDPQLVPPTFISALETDTTLPLKNWYLYNFIPENELTLLYGNGGIGKSTLASWFASIVLKQGKSVGFAGVEEPFERFVVRTMLSDPSLKREDFARMYNIGNDWKFPEHEDRLREALAQCHIDFLYFDSIYTHFGAVTGHEGVRARTCLSPLAAIAQEMGVTVVGTFHENKAGELLGSVEMRNVCRVLIRAQRAKNKHLKASVVKTNFQYPSYDLQFHSEQRRAVSLDGQPWREKNEDGQIVDVEMHVITGYLKVSDDAEEESTDPEDIVYDLDAIEDDHTAEIQRMFKENPFLTERFLADHFHTSRRKVRLALGKKAD